MSAMPYACCLHFCYECLTRERGISCDISFICILSTVSLGTVCGYLSHACKMRTKCMPCIFGLPFMHVWHAVLWKLSAFFALAQLSVFRANMCPTCIEKAIMGGASHVWCMHVVFLLFAFCMGMQTGAACIFVCFVCISGSGMPTLNLHVVCMLYALCETSACILRDLPSCPLLSLAFPCFPLLFLALLCVPCVPTLSFAFPSHPCCHRPRQSLSVVALLVCRHWCVP